MTLKEFLISRLHAIRLPKCLAKGATIKNTLSRFVLFLLVLPFSPPAIRKIVRCRHRVAEARASSCQGPALTFTIIYVYVCVYINKYIYIFIYIYVYIHTYIYIYNVSIIYIFTYLTIYSFIRFRTLSTATCLLRTQKTRKRVYELSFFFFILPTI